jgi:transposase
VLYRRRTGVPLHDLPGEFAEWDAEYNRWRRWVRSGGAWRLAEPTVDGRPCGSPD